MEWLFGLVVVLNGGTICIEKMSYGNYSRKWTWELPRIV